MGNDLTGDEIAEIVKRLKKNDGGVVRTFVSPGWTLEHDLAVHGLAKQMHVAITIADLLKNKDGKFAEADREAAVTAAEADYAQNFAALGAAERAAKIYEPVFDKKVSKPETAQVLADILLESAIAPDALRVLLPGYLTEAIDYVTSADPPAPGPAAPAPAAHVAAAPI